METNQPSCEVFEVTTVQTFNSPTVHVGHNGRGGVVSECNGRTMFGFSDVRPVTEVTCKRCRKMVTQ